MTKIGFLVVAALLVLIPASAQSQTEIVLEAHDGGGEYWFQLEGNSERNPDLNLIPGDSYQITLRNLGNSPHNVHFGGSLDLATSMIGGGQNASLAFTAPSGGMEYWCDPHRSLGMMGVGIAEEKSEETPGFSLLLGAVVPAAMVALKRR